MKNKQKLHLKEEQFSNYMSVGRVINEVLETLEYLRVQQNEDRDAICELQNKRAKTVSTNCQRDFADWWDTQGKQYRNEMTIKEMAVFAWGAGQQNKIILPQKCIWEICQTEKGFKTQCGGIVEYRCGDKYCCNCGGKIEVKPNNLKNVDGDVQ